LCFLCFTSHRSLLKLIHGSYHSLSHGIKLLRRCSHYRSIFSLTFPLYLALFHHFFSMIFSFLYL
jgi:hypothetical protein